MSSPASPAIRTPLEAVLLILSYEQLRLTIYRDASPGRYPTGGWGHKLVGNEIKVHPVGSTITRDQANDWFMEDLAAKERELIASLEPSPQDVVLGEIVTPYLYGVEGGGLTGLQFGALVSLAFNVGVAGIGKGLRNALRNDLASVPGWILRYDKSGGKVMPGLPERREAEAAMWARGGLGK